MNNVNCTISIRISQKQRKSLKKIYKIESGKASERAHMVLPYKQGYKIETIAEICLRDRNTVSSTLKSFAEEGFAGLYDKERSGCPRILNTEDDEYLFSAIDQSPHEFGYFATVWTLELLVHLLKTKRKKIIGKDALKILLHQRGWEFKRPKHIPPDPEPIEEKEQEEIIRLLKSPKEDEVILFQDESDFQLLPYLTGAWIRKGTVLEIPTPGKNQILCVFGFFNPHNKDFFYKFVETRHEKTAKNFLIVLHQIRAQFKGKKIHIVVDNSSIHNRKTTRLIPFMEKYKDELIIHFLPKRATILNPIERFWQFLKKRIVSNYLYENLDSLKDAFRQFIWHYRERLIIYNFSLTKLTRLWQKYPVANKSAHTR